MKTIPVCLIVAGLVLPAICLAESPARPRGEAPAEIARKGGGKPGGGGERSAEFWKKGDMDQDGSLSLEEFSAMPRIENLPSEKQASLFQRLDKNADGRLGRDELSRGGRPQGGDGGPPMMRLWELDLDKSGGVSLDEFKSGKFFKKLPPERQDALFARLDTNRDGTITPKDRPEPPFKERGGADGPQGADRGHPQGGKPGQGGKQGGPRMEPQQMLRQLDKDADGSISFDEFRASPMVKNLTEDEQEDRFEALDKNGDLKLSPDDLPPAPPRGDGRPPEAPDGP